MECPLGHIMEFCNGKKANTEIRTIIAVTIDTIGQNIYSNIVL